MKILFIILFFTSISLTVTADEQTPNQTSETEYQENLYGKHLTGPQGRDTALGFCKFWRTDDNTVDEECMNIAASSYFIDAFAFGLCRAQPYFNQLRCLSTIKDKVYSTVVFRKDNPESMSPEEQIEYLQSTGIIASKVPYLLHYFPDLNTDRSILNDQGIPTNPF